MESKKWHLSSIDISRCFTNALIFLSPLGIIYFTSVISNMNDGVFSWSIFKITSLVAGSLMLYVLNTLLDLFRKLAQNNTIK